MVDEKTLKLLDERTASSYGLEGIHIPEHLRLDITIWHLRNWKKSNMLSFLLLRFPMVVQKDVTIFFPTRTCGVELDELGPSIAGQNVSSPSGYAAGNKGSCTEPAANLT